MSRPSCDSLAIRVITDAGDSVSSFGRLPADERVQIRREFEGGIVLASNMLRPLRDRVFLRTSGGRILLARGAQGEVRVMRSDGSVTEIWQFPGLRQAATTDALSRWTELRVREVPDREVDDLRGILETFPPSEMPAFVALIVGADGSIWLGMPSVGPTRPWVIVSSEGALHGYIELPRELDLRAATNEKVVGVVTDELGVDRVRVYDLLPAF